MSAEVEPLAALAVAAASGDRRRTLEELRDVLARSIDEVDARYRAPLAKQLSDTLAAIAALPESKEVSASDDLAARRLARRSTPSTATSSS